MYIQRCPRDFHLVNYIRIENGKNYKNIVKSLFKQKNSNYTF